MASRAASPIASAPLDSPAPAARIALLVLHGIERDAGIYFLAAARAARRAGPAAEAGTLLVVPRFLGRREARRERLDHGALVWRTQAWKEGGDSAGAIGDRSARVSAFAALDALLAAFADRKRFPALERVVIAGHSAGAQLVQRYAAASDGEAPLAAAGVAVRYVVANPSSYLYLDGSRPAADGTFAPPPAAVLAACPQYDDWKYGLRNLPAYLAATGEAERVRARYGGRDVIYLLGARDNDAAHPHLDGDCAAMLQGADRRARGKAFQAHLREVYGPGIAERHVAVVVGGVGHSAARILRSRAARRYLFGGTAPALAPADAPAGASSERR